MQYDRPAHDTLWKLPNDIKFGMFTHRNAFGVLQGQPLTTQNQSLDDNSLAVLLCTSRQ